MINVDELSMDEVNALIKRLADDQEEQEGFKNPFLWTEDEIHDLVMREVGVDILYPRGFQVLVKIWTPSTKYDSGLDRPEHERRAQRITTRVGKVLRMGREAFRDPGRFPLGPRATYGEWMLFRSLERELIQVNNVFLANLNDDED